MKFTDFLNYVPKILNQELPALNAHAKMAPSERIQSLNPDFYKDSNPKQSAVMMLFYPKQEQTHLILIRRNEYPGVHSAQISFPGGQVDPEDVDLKHTALRETYEEIGVTPAEIDVVMPFSQIYIPPSNFLVKPFMGLAAQTPVFVPNPDEVTALIELPLDVFLDDSIVINTEMKTSYAQKIAVPAFKFEDYIVWGATAMIMSELKETIKNAL
ncbi:NUDIX hydrolase [Flavobacterium beibuense]|uniref:Putative pyrophosphohydrolase n=1 Tax=Flavobacterium beibuense TaxID=657326 RepID=A0A444W8T1_9FLAO|nr:CoA pyrophosphatase [Flavobacterium beibuense]RYJ42311.1 putative pyrophosphohydrolase [Flavobacterium beibuense]